MEDPTPKNQGTGNYHSVEQSGPNQPSDEGIMMIPNQLVILQGTNDIELPPVKDIKKDLVINELNLERQS
jgi:hypothetical protein